jgi:hypothetical protein
VSASRIARSIFRVGRKVAGDILHRCGRAPHVVLDLGEADGRAEMRNVRRLGERRIAEQELWRHAPSPPFEEGRARHVLAAQEASGKIANGAHDERRHPPHQQPHPVALRRHHVPPVAAERAMLSWRATR